ncbi:hypothetical protein DHEL01_v200043 [Diaporthe helianthi]|uniref:Uncharacterized protein n=1 Tax=Diaporthe helianthi TaxID=158607 RepID=A0A2P5IGH9_DIAHE|nr:hypothetical protein DHEL01_v200043 [Diaporthe helianthi]
MLEPARLPGLHRRARGPFGSWNCWLLHGFASETQQLAAALQKPSHPSRPNSEKLQSSTNNNKLYLTTRSTPRLQKLNHDRQLQTIGIDLSSSSTTTGVDLFEQNQQAKHYDSSSSASSYGSFSSSDSDVSASSVRASMERPIASIEIIRCLRCARCVEMTTTDDASMYGMIRVGTGIYYCDRCARMTGYGNAQARACGDEGFNGEVAKVAAPDAAATSSTLAIFSTIGNRDDEAATQFSISR